MTSRRVALDACRPGTAGRILEIRADGPVGQRLLEMGLVDGSDVRVVRAAPLGDPIEVEVLGYALTLRRSEAAAILVEVTS
jgi:ferrous iron transport protein A